MKLQTLPRHLLDPDPDQPRRSVDETEEKQLALSIREHGLLQPLIVVPNNARYSLVDGHRRFGAMGLLQMPEVQAIVLDQKPDADTLLLTQLAANCMRVDLKPMEKALAFRRLQEMRGWSHAELAKAMHVCKAVVTQILSYLDLPEQAQAMLDAGELAGSTAYAISRAPDEATRMTLLERAIAGDLKRDEAARQVSRNGDPRPRHRFVFLMNQLEISFCSTEELQLDDVIQVIRQLNRECRKAVSQGMNIKTLERFMQDKAKQAS